MAESRRKFDQDFKEGAVRLVRETGHPIARIAKDLGINPGTLSNWVVLDRQAKDGNGRLSEDDRIELARLRRENAELAMVRVLKRAQTPGSHTIYVSQPRVVADLIREAAAKASASDAAV